MYRLKDDVREWPSVTHEGIQEYFINHRASDDQNNANYRALVEGQNYLRSGWIGKIQHIIRDQHVVLCGKVRFSQLIDSYHNVQVTVCQKTSGIVSVECDCIANKGKCCSHTAGLLYKINQASVLGYTGWTCTDSACKWNSSTSENVLPDTVENIRGAKGAKLRTASTTVTSLETDEEVIKHLSSSVMTEVTKIPGTIIHHVLTAKPVTVPRPNIVENCLPKEHGSCCTRECVLCNRVYKQYIEVTEERREQLAEATKGQTSRLWRDQRKIRITSSDAAGVPKKTDPKKWITRKLNNRFLGNEATRHGKECEPLAREEYCRDTNQTVQMTGLVVHPTENWLAASLDGIVDADTIIEIKCPTDKTIQNNGGSLSKLIESNKYEVRHKDGTCFLHQSASGHGYYYQVQIAMHCSGRKLCKFIVWTNTEYVVVDVPYNQEWIEQRVDHLRHMYFRHLLPAIATKFAYDHVKIEE